MSGKSLEERCPSTQQQRAAARSKAKKGVGKGGKGQASPEPSNLNEGRRWSWSLIQWSPGENQRSETQNLQKVFACWGSPILRWIHHAFYYENFIHTCTDGNKCKFSLSSSLSGNLRLGSGRKGLPLVCVQWGRSRSLSLGSRTLLPRGTCERICLFWDHT